MYLNHRKIYDVDKCTKMTSSRFRFDRDVDKMSKCVVFESESYENFQVRPRRGPGHHVQALDGAGDADQARW